MSGDLYKRILSWDKDHKDRNVRLLAAGILTAAGVTLLVVDFANSSQSREGTITRNDYGKGSKTEELEVRVGEDSERVPVQIEVAERNYTSKEVRELFQRTIRRMDTFILGENKSLDRVENDLNLLTVIPDEPIEVEWELDRYDVMNIKGEIQKENLEEKGTVVQLKAVLSYKENPEEQAVYQCAVNVCKKKLTKQEEKKAQIESAVRKSEEGSRSKQKVALPEKILGKKAVYYHGMENRGLVLAVMGALAGGLFLLLEKQNQWKNREKRKQQMMLDYPEIVNKLTLFLGAGMTIKRAFKKVAEDYEEGKERRGTREAYEEMRQTCYEMGRGVTESESYENFGRRCNVQAYVRLGALLSQNIRKGTKGLTQLLKMESVQAFEERKANARRRGEEAGTKLLLPMFLMLAVVLIIVIIPAFLSMQI